MLSDGEVDAAIQTPAFTSRWDNYWVEGILWLAKNLEIDGARRDRAAIKPRSRRDRAPIWLSISRSSGPHPGIYLDGAPYEYTILRRLRRALEPILKGREFKLDIHASCYGETWRQTSHAIPARSRDAGPPERHPRTCLIRQPALAVRRALPVSRLDLVRRAVQLQGVLAGAVARRGATWRPLSLARPAPRAHTHPTHAQVSGVPFGLPGQILGDNSDQWHGLLFGMTCRIYPDPHRCNPRPLYQVR